MLRCTDCHSPHSQRRVTLGGRTQLCTGCHQDYAGPWIWEHAPVTEDCGYCHEPHGATAQGLLEVTQPGSCISCHSLPAMGAVHDPWALLDRCSNCHSAIHGSYTDPHLRR
jgi:predicted CXXCH cytochrome family protein